MEHAPQTLSDMGRSGTVRFPRALKAQVADSQVCSRTHCQSNHQKVLMTQLVSDSFFLFQMNSGLDQLFHLVSGKQYKAKNVHNLASDKTFFSCHSIKSGLKYKVYNLNEVCSLQITIIATRETRDGTKSYCLVRKVSLKHFLLALPLSMMAIKKTKQLKNMAENRGHWHAI